MKKVYNEILKKINEEIEKSKIKNEETHLIFLNKAKEKIENLKSKNIFPQNSKDLKDVDVLFKAKILREELKENFNIKFKVNIERYSMGSSIYVYWNDGPAKKKVEEIVKKYSNAGNTNVDIDYFDYDNYAFAIREVSNYDEIIKKFREEGLNDNEAFYRINNIDL